ncbi:SDR family NAD(P)-dependent oxidoreductase [Rubrimonas cliftonensis]|uniref:Short-chain dehydrogenase n=1 Tax=Rubrimonas cliftonensis TaxID=89524 RepID=A0A1H4CJW2_9RHOB|nr:SDR family NAD(P)-dependent oxidoreductase [Rubrimonas cliftonensis]SEA60619.1 Short-chain dehydrogenase [Rubrimonas cliftonensis]
MTRSILITGCSSGIGLDAARALRARGWRVLATCRAEADCERLRGEGLESFALDYADEGGVLAAAATALERTDGRLDATFHNGAYAIPGFIEDLPTDALRAIFEANFIGWHVLTRALLPAMRAHAAAGGGGRLVFCSSVLGFAPVRWRGAYVATKHALEGYADVLRLELRGEPLRVSLIEPGPVATRFNENARAQFARWIDRDASARRADYAAIDARYGENAKENAFSLPPAAVTRKLVHAVESPRPKARYYVTTPTYAVAALKRLAPRAALDWLMAKQ